MFEFLTASPAVALLIEDHDRVKELFDQFEAAKTKAAKVKIARAALVELKVHAAIEEDLFYPAVRKPVGKEIMNEDDEEHHVQSLNPATAAFDEPLEAVHGDSFPIKPENLCRRSC